MAVVWPERAFQERAKKRPPPPAQRPPKDHPKKARGRCPNVRHGEPARRTIKKKKEIALSGIRIADRSIGFATLSPSHNPW